MASPYTSTSVSGYNANPPPDDGTTGANNRETWAGVKTKLGDPLNTFASSVNTNIIAAFGKTLDGAGTATTAVDYPMTASDQGRLIIVTASGKTVTTPDATVVGSPFVFGVLNRSAGTITLKGNGTQNVDGSNTQTINPGAGALVQTDASNWFTFGLKAATLGSLTTVGDAAYTILATDIEVVTNAAFTVARTWTLPAASAYPVGQRLTIADRQNTVTGTNTLTVSRAGADTILAPGGTVTSLQFSAPGAVLVLVSDGVSKWLVDSFRHDPTVQRFTSGTAQTYTPTPGTVRIRVRMCGGGGGGGAQATNAGANGGDTSFGSWTAIHGNGGAAGAGGAGGAGGTGGVNGTGTLVVRYDGQAGGGSGGGAIGFSGGGGSTPFGGGGPAHGDTGQNNAKTNTGGGGSGGGTQSGAAAAGGGASEYVEFWVSNPANTTYTVGGGGNGGAAGTQAGGNGAAGIIVIEEFYA